MALDRKTYIYIKDGTSWNVLTDSDGNESVIVAGTMSLESTLCSGNLNFGECNASKFEVQLFRCPDISGEYIKVIQLSSEYTSISESDFSEYDLFTEIGKSLETESALNIEVEGFGVKSLFTGYVDSCKQDSLGYDRELIAYDVLYSIRSNNIALKWNAWRLSATSYTLTDLYTTLMDWGGISSYDSITGLPNYNMTIYTGFTLDTKRWGDMLSEVLQLMGAFGHIDGTGKFKVITLSTSGATNVSGYETENSTFETYATEKITGSIFKDSTGTIGYYKYSKDSSGAIIPEYGNNPYIMTTSLCSGFDETTLAGIMQAFTEAVENISYYPVSVKMIASDMNLDLGDYISVNGKLTYIFANQLSGEMLIEQTLIATGDQWLNEASEDSEAYGVTTSTSTPQYCLWKYADAGENNEHIPETELSDDDWSDTLPDYETRAEGYDYYWVRYKTVAPNGTVSYSYPSIPMSTTTKAYSSSIVQLPNLISAEVNAREEAITGVITDYTSKIELTESHITAEVAERKEAIDGVVEDYTSKIEETAKSISAKVSKTITSADSETMEWDLVSSSFTVKANGIEVLKVTKDGLTVTGGGTFTGTVSAGAIVGGTIDIGLQSDKTYAFSVDSSGNLKATSADISGSVTITSGEITLGSKSGKTYFHVSSSGELTAYTGTFSGSIEGATGAFKGTMSASNLTTGTIDASKITVSNISASNITSGTIDASKITVSNINASNITSGTINASTVTITNLNASNITSGTMSANRISGGTIDASQIAVTNLNASNLTSGTINASTITISNINASSITSGTLSASYISGGTLNASSMTVSNLSASVLTAGTIKVTGTSSGIILDTSGNTADLSSSDSGTTVTKASLSSGSAVVQYGNTIIASLSSKDVDGVHYGYVNLQGSSGSDSLTIDPYDGFKFPSGDKIKNVVVGTELPDDPIENVLYLITES